VNVDWLDTANLPRRVLGDIASSIMQALPREAVGLVWEPAGIAAVHIPLTNTSDDPEHSYAVSVEEIALSFLRTTGGTIEGAADLTLWHSHPSGQNGPSRGDMRERVEGLRYMVVAVDKDQSLSATLF
jgi:proteasome lid subunit RPN8/RPN11